MEDVYETVLTWRQLFKAINRLPGLSESDVDQDAILLRAYGRGTQVLIDRDRE